MFIYRPIANPELMLFPLTGVLDEPYSQLTPANGEAVQARPETQGPPAYIGWNRVQFHPM
jgi:hypothetical protein